MDRRQGDRQARLQNLRCQQGRRGIAQLIIAPQGRERQRGQVAGFCVQGPVCGVSRQGKIRADEVQIGTDRLRLSDQAAGSIGIGADGRFAGTENAGFLKTDGFAGASQPVDMIQGDAGDDGTVRLIDIHGI